MERIPEVRTGFWTNHDKSSWNMHQYTTSERTNTALQLIIGVLFGAAWPLLSDILVRAEDWRRYWYHRLSEKQNRGTESIADADDRTPLLDERRRHASSSTEDHADALEAPDDAESGQTRALVRNQRRSPASSNRGSSASNNLASPAKSVKKSARGWKSMSLSLVLIAISMAYLVAGSFPTTIPVELSGLSASKHCGSWSLRKDAGKEAEDDDDLLQAQKEMRAGQYGRDCYGHRSVTSPDRCAFFKSQAISYNVQIGQECPFKDKHFCAGGGYTAARFTTGLVDASVLGINTGKPPKFNRTTICVPLYLDQGFVKEIPPGPHQHDYQYEYHLGPVNDSDYHSNYTFRMFGDPFKWDVPAYSVSAYEATPYPEKNYWTPRHELDITPPGPTYFTIMFISSCRIVYTGPSKDYIFHADEEYPPRRDRYWNPDPRARPLACVDWNEVCTSDGKCSPMDEEHSEYGKEYEFTRSALRKSTTFHAIQFRLGTALVAQESVGDYESLPLDDYQWIIESEALFNTSLARIQYDTLDIATGVGHEKDPGSYEPETPSWARDKLCGIYKFQLPKGYTNINVWATIGILGLVALIFIIGQETCKEFTEDKKPWFKGNWMVFDLILWGLYFISKGSIDGVKYITRAVSTKVKGWWERRHHNPPGLQINQLNSIEAPSRLN